ncbi:cupin domain-containing protein [Spirosoma panaciterrae]|uniref:cupin domain-containing protein n=1 Tax=Spirosoma panaciterrae TaxID=496058 RepID=UPI00036EC8B0|nr:cupin domain-containing protein [Spirosoma panaciterrae]
MKDPLVPMHPDAIETYEVLEGEMEFYIHNQWVAAKKGDHLPVPKGVTHCFRNPSPTTVRVLNTHQPALKMEDYFEDVCKVLDKVTDQRRKRFRMSPRAMLYMSVLMNTYRAEIIARNPPDVAIKVLGWVAKVLGIKY